MKKLLIGALLVPIMLLMVVGIFLLNLLQEDKKAPQIPMGTGGIGTATVSADVLKWEPLVRKHAQTFGMEQYIFLALALIEQESGGRLVDVMQSAEGAFNTKYPKVMNGITDSDYSVWCGIQELKHSLELAGVTGPTDIERIKLALQSYNFGPGFSTMYKKMEGLILSI
ncbi:lysozyme family protein [Bacillus toyonensis]